MSEETVTVPTEVVLPDLNRDAVANRSDGVPFIEFEAYGRYVLRLVQFKADPGKKNNPHFRADCIVVESTNVAYEPGAVVSVHFPTGRQGTATDPAKKERDDERIARFLCAVFKRDYKEIKAKTFDATAQMKNLLKAGKLPEDKQVFKFVFTRAPGPTKKKLDQKTEQVVDVTFPRDRFDAVA